MMDTEDSGEPQPRTEDVLEIGGPATRSWPPARWLRRAVAPLLHGRARVVAAIASGALLVALGVTAFVMSSHSNGEPDLAATRNQIRALEQRQRQDVVNGDAADLNRLLAPEFMVVTPDGDQLTRDDYLYALTTGDLDFHAFKFVSPVGIRTDGHQAVVTFSSKLDVSAGKTHLRHQAWHTEVWEKTHDRWQVVWAQTTAIGGFPPPRAAE
jgi:hypothetical protein